MKITYKAKYDLTKPCVARLWFGDRYLIVKWPDMEESILHFRAKFVDGTGSDTLENFVIGRMRRKIGTGNLDVCEVEIMLVSYKGEELIAKEQALLNQADRLCLNHNTMPFHPKWIYGLIAKSETSGDFFSIKGRHRSAPAVVKLWVGDKFFIWKCKDVQVFPDQINRSIIANIRNFNLDSGDRMNPLVKYIIDNRIGHGGIEVLYKAKPKNKTWLKKFMAFERKLLVEHVRTKDCLNNTIRQWKPKWMDEI